MTSTKAKNYLLFVPIVGSLLFVILYVIAATLYPGGSNADKTSVGYSLANNYWCNLLYKNGINGEHNAGQPFAAAGMFVMCIALSGFWIFYPLQTCLKKYHRLLIQVPGVTGMAFSFLLLTDLDHDLVINLSSSLCLVAIIATMGSLYNTRGYKLFAWGLFNLVLVGVNNYLYHTKGMMDYLPIVQKISFASFLIWFCLISLVYSKSSQSRDMAGAA